MYEFSKILMPKYQNPLRAKYSVKIINRSITELNRYIGAPNE